MTILTCHELGHYLQTLRYRVYSSLPYFIPLPLPEPSFGTMGAVIAMDGTIPNRRALFDIGISGPLAGLVPTLFCCYYGILWSSVAPSIPGETEYNDPLLLKWMITMIHGELAPDLAVYIHPIGMAGWAGLLLTTLNLMPVSQLDGGHIFYALLGRNACVCSWLLMLIGGLAIIYFGLWNLMLVYFLLFIFGVEHPPTENDNQNKPGIFRQLLGWATLAFIIVGFTPMPISIDFQAVPPRIPTFYV
jgi:membrane-associated protease RseP (regulator of RpoE activity)